MKNDWRIDLISFYMTSGVATSYLHSVLLSRSRENVWCSGGCAALGKMCPKGGAAHVLRKPTITGADAEGRNGERRKRLGKGRRQPTLTSYTSVLALRTGASKCEDGEEYTSVALFSVSLHLPSGKLIIIHRYDIL